MKKKPSQTKRFVIMTLSQPELTTPERETSTEPPQHVETNTKASRRRSEYLVEHLCAQCSSPSETETSRRQHPEKLLWQSYRGQQQPLKSHSPNPKVERYKALVAFFFRNFSSR